MKSPFKLGRNSSVDSVKHSRDVKLFRPAPTTEHVTLKADPELTAKVEAKIEAMNQQHIAEMKKLIETVEAKKTETEIMVKSKLEEKEREI